MLGRWDRLHAGDGFAVSGGPRLLLGKGNVIVATPAGSPFKMAAGVRAIRDIIRGRLGR